MFSRKRIAERAPAWTKRLAHLLGSPVSGMGITLAALIVMAAFLAATARVAWHRGIWYDEIWSLYFAHHDLGFWRALNERWLLDNHPPAFYALSWLSWPLLGDNLFARRMMNALPVMLAAASIVWMCRTDRRVANFAVVMALLLLGTTHGFAAMLDHRGYMTQIAADAVLAVASYRIATASEDYGAGDLKLLGLVGAALMVAFNLHYFSAFITGMFVAILVASWWFTGKRRWAMRLLIAAILAGAPLVAAYLIERSLLAETARTFWATTSTQVAIRQVKRLIGSAYPVNIVAVGALLLALALRMRRKREVVFASGALAFAVTIAIAILITSAAMLTMNMIRPFLAPRYLAAMAPFAAALLAALSAETIARYRWLLLVAVLASLAAIHESFMREIGLQQWNATASQVAKQVRACPGTIVHARPRWIIPDDEPPQVVAVNEPTVIRFGYEYVARNAGFAIEPEKSVRVAATCPTLLWIEQHDSVTPDLAAELAGLPLTSGQIARGRVIQGETGFVILYPPAIGNRTTGSTKSD